MSRIIVIANQKGGVAKTTTTVNLGIGLARKGMRVLVIDNDPQASLTVSLGFHHPERLDYTMTSVLNKVIKEEEFDPRECIIHHKEGVDLLPSNATLNSVESALLSIVGGEQILGEYIGMIKDDYDFILIDCSPNLGMLTYNALAAGDEVIIPVLAEFLPAKGLELLLTTIRQIQKRANKNLVVKGILITMVDARTNFAKDVTNLLKEAYGDKIHIFENMIPNSIRAAEASATGSSIYVHDPKGTVAAAYNALTWEVMA